MSKRKRQQVRARTPNIYNHYAPPPPITPGSRKSGHRGGPMILIVGFTVFIALVLAGITYANLSQRSGGGIFGMALSKSNDSMQGLTANACGDNRQRQELVVSISKRHMWACSYTVPVQNAPVVTGMDMYAADITPTGTYHIEQKQQNIQLTGADSTGSWNVHVDYWMQFLQNQYGRYGFHDALWRKPSEFGNTSPSSHTASHGCVETPLATMKWIYDWAPVGTAVVIKA